MDACRIALDTRSRPVSARTEHPARGTGMTAAATRILSSAPDVIPRPAAKSPAARRDCSDACCDRRPPRARPPPAAGPRPRLRCRGTCPPTPRDLRETFRRSAPALPRCPTRAVRWAPAQSLLQLLRGSQPSSRLKWVFPRSHQRFENLKLVPGPSIPLAAPG